MLSELQSSGVIVGPLNITGKKSSIERIAKITSKRLTIRPNISSEAKGNVPWLSSDEYPIRKSSEASKTAIREAINIRHDAR